MCCVILPVRGGRSERRNQPSPFCSFRVSRRGQRSLRLVEQSGGERPEGTSVRHLIDPRHPTSLVWSFASLPVPTATPGTDPQRQTACLSAGAVFWQGKSTLLGSPLESLVEGGVMARQGGRAYSFVYFLVGQCVVNSFLLAACLIKYLLS